MTDCQNLPLPHGLSIVVPCYNEHATLPVCLDQLIALREKMPDLEIIVVDDGSTDGTADIAKAYAGRHPQLIVLHLEEHNHGKGYAARTGIRLAKQDVIALQDADLEYDPEDLVRMLALMHSKRADAVIGSRFINTEGQAVFFWHRLGNRMVTLLSNIVSDLYLTDITCCYKLVRRDLLQRMMLRENGFGIDTEIVMRLAAIKRRHRYLRIYETKVSYESRSYAEGKKIRLRHIWPILWVILRYRGSAIDWSAPR